MTTTTDSEPDDNQEEPTLSGTEPGDLYIYSVQCIWEQDYLYLYKTWRAILQLELVHGN